MSLSLNILRRMNKYIFSLVLIFLLSCQAQKTESEEISNAKWFYYAYAKELNGYSNSGQKTNPLNCNIKVNSIDSKSRDTTKFYFSLYKKDTLNICYLKPLGLVGVTVVRNKLYSPIYHGVTFDTEADSLILKNMDKLSLLLQEAFESDKESNSWLQTEAKHRKYK